MTNKLRLVAITILVALLVLSHPTRAQVNATSDTISVTGEAEVRIVPDEVILTLGVETFDKVLKIAKTANDERIRRTITIARGYGIPAEYIQTDYIGIEPRRRVTDTTLELFGYFVRKTVVIRLRDLSKFEGLLTDALEAGVTNVHGIDFRTTELRKHRDAARTLALKAAQEKAQLLAKESGRHIGAVLSIGEAAYGYWSSYGSWWGGRDAWAAQNVVQTFGGVPIASDATLAPGQISIRANVSISLRLG